MKTAATQVGDVTSYIAQEDGKSVFGTIQDMTPYAEQAKALHAAGAHGSSDFRHAASLPFVAIETYMNTNGITFEEWCSNPIHVKRMLADPALSAFRIWPGKV